MAMAEQQQQKGSSSENVKVLKLPPLPAMSPSQQQKAAPRRPSAEEMIQYYCRKGLDKQAATEKVVDDLQKALTIAVSRYPRNPQKSVHSVSGTLDSLATRLSAVEAKVDEKPDLGGVFVAAVAAGGVLQAVPHVLRAISQVGRSIKDTISSKP